MDEEYTDLGWRRLYRQRLIDWLTRPNPNLHPAELFHVARHIREIDQEIAGIERGAVTDPGPMIGQGSNGMKQHTIGMLTHAEALAGRGTQVQRSVALHGQDTVGLGPQGQELVHKGESIIGLR